MTQKEREKVAVVLALLRKKNQSGQSLILKQAIEILEEVLGV
jgi:hypothetical protein